jgi:hypothetical protein
MKEVEIGRACSMDEGREMHSKVLIEQLNGEV